MPAIPLSVPSDSLFIFSKSMDGDWDIGENGFRTLKSYYSEGLGARV